MTSRKIAENLKALRLKVSKLGFTDEQISHLEELSISSIEDAEVQEEVRKLLA